MPQPEETCGQQRDELNERVAQGESAKAKDPPPCDQRGDQGANDNPHGEDGRQHDQHRDVHGQEKAANQARTQGGGHREVR